jgi:hypothetical protein
VGTVSDVVVVVVDVKMAEETSVVVDVTVTSMGRVDVSVTVSSSPVEMMSVELITVSCYAD